MKSLKTNAKHLDEGIKGFLTKVEGFTDKAEKSFKRIDDAAMKSIDDVSDKFGVLQKKLMEIKTAGEDTWESFTGGVKSVLSEVEGAVKTLTT